MSTTAEIASTGNSSAVSLALDVEAQLDIDVPMGGGEISAISYTVQTRANDDSEWKTIKLPSDPTEAWTFTDESGCMEIPGNRQYRIVVASRTGTGTVTVNIRRSVSRPN
jgi:hypothetical protein